MKITDRKIVIELSTKELEELVELMHEGFKKEGITWSIHVINNYDHLCTEIGREDLISI